MVVNRNSQDRIAPDTEIGTVRLAVRDINLIKNFYHDVIGLTIIAEGKEFVDLGVGEKLLVKLVAKPGGISYSNSAGLFHLAILLPSRAELGAWLKHFLQLGYRLDGVGDHLVSEALYLSDPEGNGIEMYRDRPRETWQYHNGQIRMDTLAVDLESLLTEASAGPFEGLPEGTQMGHIHLQVNNVAKTAAFYSDVLGFDLVAQMPGAGFLSAGGYHHHIGMNTWRSRGGGFAPENALGLIDYTVLLPTASSRESLLNRLAENQIDFKGQNGNLRVQDPAGIWIDFIVRS